MNDMTNINMKLNIKRKNKMNINSFFQYENRRIRADNKNSYACLSRVFKNVNGKNENSLKRCRCPLWQEGSITRKSPTIWETIKEKN